MTPKEHMTNLTDEIHLINSDSHVDQANEFVAFDNLQKALFELQKAFEYNNKNS